MKIKENYKYFHCKNSNRDDQNINEKYGIFWTKGVIFKFYTIIIIIH